MKITARAILAAVVVSAMSLLFGVASAQQQPSASAIATARQLLELKGAFSVYDNAVPGLIDQVKTQLMQNNISYQKDINEIAAKLAQDLQGRDAEMGTEMAQTLRHGFYRAGAQGSAELLQVAARQEGVGTGAEDDRR